jgi:DNA invertase Pin-like site-specific DNA recombinase
MKAALYTRVSTKKQNTDRQVTELQAYAQKQGFEVVLVICETVSGSVKKVDRPGLEQVLDLARRGEITEVVSLELSRLGRNAMDVRQIIFDLIELGVCTHIVNRNLRSLDGKRRKDSIVMMLLGVLADLAEMEKEQLVERINSGLDEARRKNKTLGRPKGSTLSPKELLELYPGVVKDLNGGLSLRKTAAFRKVSLDTVQRVKKVLNTVISN